MIATDLDRTLLPNGVQEESLGVRERFFEYVDQKGSVLVYVTGRSKLLFEDAQQEYGIKTPEYLIGDVGTTVYVHKDEELVAHDEWAVYLADQNPNWNFAGILKHVGIIASMRLQEEDKLNPYKISYYVDTLTDRDEIVGHITEVLARMELDAEVVWSVDGDTGLIDVLPRGATKATALQFLLTNLGIAPQDVVYAGDSGNDLLVFEALERCVLVGNAREEVRQEVLDINTKRTAEGLPEIYIANANYAEGILEGLEHFA